MMLVTDSYLYRQFGNDPFVKANVLDSAKQVIPVFAIQSITDYRISIFNLMNSFVQNDIYYEQLSFGISLANILLFVLIALRIFFKLRQIE